MCLLAELAEALYRRQNKRQIARTRCTDIDARAPVHPRFFPTLHANRTQMLHVIMLHLKIKTISRLDLSKFIRTGDCCCTVGLIYMSAPGRGRGEWRRLRGMQSRDGGGDSAKIIHQIGRAERRRSSPGAQPRRFQMAARLFEPTGVQVRRPLTSVAAYVTVTGRDSPASS